MTDKILIDRAVVEQALHALKYSSACISKQLTTQTKHDYALGLLAEANDALRAALEQPQVEQEPVTEVGVIGWKNHLPNAGTVVHWTALMPPLGTKLYTHPQPPRQPLTDEQIDKLDWGPRPDEPMSFKEALREFARAIEAAHGIGGEK